MREMAYLRESQPIFLIIATKQRSNRKSIALPAGKPGMARTDSRAESNLDCFWQRDRRFR